jgi:hypothetical protein
MYKILNNGSGVLGSAVVSWASFIKDVDWLGMSAGVVSLIISLIIGFKTFEEFKIKQLERIEKELKLKREFGDEFSG